MEVHAPQIPKEKGRLTMDLRAGKHPDEDALDKYFLGSLGQRAAEQIEEHLLVCQMWLKNARELDVYIQAMRKAMQTEQKEAKAAKNAKT
jgi:hypothetical protein